MAVAAFLIPDAAGVEVLLSVLLLHPDTGVAVRDGGPEAAAATGGGAFLSSTCALLPSSSPFALAPFFFRFLEPGAFLRECVSPRSESCCNRRLSLSFSSSFTGKIGMTLSDS